MEIEKILKLDKDRNIIKKMKQNGFELVGNPEKYQDDYYFISKDSKKIIFISFINQEYYIYNFKKFVRL